MSSITSYFTCGLVTHYWLVYTWFGYTLLVTHHLVWLHITGYTSLGLVTHYWLLYTWFGYTLLDTLHLVWVQITSYSTLGFGYTLQVTPHITG